MKKILVTYAVQGEFAEITWPDVEVFYVRTGVGKMKSTYYLTDILNQFKPDIVINMGTAGSINHKIGEIFVCRQFIDRDMQELDSYNDDYVLDTSALLAERGFCKHWTESATCNTGDRFVLDPEGIEGDVIDMEAYAQAFVCLAKEVPFISVKFVTDIIGKNSVQHWEGELENAREGLAHFLNVLKESI